MTQLSFIGARIPTEVHKWAIDKYRNPTTALTTVLTDAMNADNEAVNNDNQPDLQYLPASQKLNLAEVTFEIDRQTSIDGLELLEFMELDNLNELGLVAFKSFIQQRSDSASNQVLGFEDVTATENEELREARKEISEYHFQGKQQAERILELERLLTDTVNKLTDTDNKLTEAVNKLTAQSDTSLTDTVNTLTHQSATPLTGTVNEPTEKAQMLDPSIYEDEIELLNRKYKALSADYEVSQKHLDHLRSSISNIKKEHKNELDIILNTEHPETKLLPLLVADTAKIVMDYEDYSQSIGRKLRYRTKEGIVAEFIRPELLPYFPLPQPS